MTTTTFIDNSTSIKASWLNDVNTSTYTTVPALTVSDAAKVATATLADTSNIANGDALIGVKLNATGAVARTQHDKNAETVSVKDFGAVGNGIADDYQCIQNALDYLNSVGGGTLRFPSGNYLHSSPLKVYTNTRVTGSGKANTFLTKTGSTAISLTGAEATQANASLVCLDLSPMSDGASHVNCSIWISDAIRASYVEVAYMTIRSTGSNSTGSNVKHGICGMGADDSWLHDLSIECYTGASIVMPVYFAGTIERVHSSRCNQGPSIEAGTSLTIQSNYSLYCHKYGYYMRSVKYSIVKNNACDGLNNVSNSADYTDRTIDSRAYEFNACYAMEVVGNGAEQCFGSMVVIDSCVGMAVKSNVFHGPASSYTGANQVALFQVLQLCQNITIESNTVLRGGVTAIQGAANAANHHDLYVNVASWNQGFKYVNNWTGNNLFDAPSAIYGNMVPTYLSNLKQGAQIFGDFTPVLTIPGATGITITPTANNKGRYSVVNGFMEIDIDLDMTTVVFGGTGNITISGLPLANQSAKSARITVDHSSGYTWATTEPYYLDIANAATSGTLKNRTDSVSPVTTSVLTTGTPSYLHLSGKVYVGDLVNVV